MISTNPDQTVLSSISKLKNQTFASDEYIFVYSVRSTDRMGNMDEIVIIIVAHKEYEKPLNDFFLYHEMYHTKN